MKNLNLLGPALLALLVLAAPALAAQDAPAVNVKAIPAAKGTYMLSGMGGNIGVLVTATEVVLIDAQYAEVYGKIDSVLKTLSGLSVGHLINTHWHGDHTGGNGSFAGAGATIVAHDQVRKRMVTGGKIAYFQKDVPPGSADALPVVTFSENANFYIGGERIEVLHVPNAHTDGDAIVWMPGKNVLHMGDLYFAGMYPFIDGSSGGGINGLIEGCELALQMTDHHSVIIPGHGPISNRAELVAWLGMLRDVHSFVKMAKDAGNGMKDVVDSADGFMRQYAEKYGKGFISARDLFAFVFNSL